MKGLGHEAKLLFTSHALHWLGRGMFTFMLATQARQLGASPVQIGAMLSLTWGLGAVLTLLGGAWADRAERRRLMLLAWGILVPAPLFFAAARHWLGLLPGHLLLQAASLHQPATSAYLTSLTEPRSRGAVWSFLILSGPLGLAVGPWLGGAAMRTWGLGAMFVSAAALQLSAFLVMLRLPRQEPGGGRGRAGSQAGDRTRGRPGGGPDGGLGLRAMTRLGSAVFSAALLFACFALLQTMGSSYFTLYLHEEVGVEMSRLGAFGSAVAIGGLIWLPLAGWLRDRRGSRLALCLSLGLVALGHGSLLTLRRSTGLLLGLSAMGASMGVSVMDRVEIGARARPAELGRAYALCDLLGMVAGTAGPLVGGLLYSQGRGLPFLAVIAGCGVLCLVSSRVMRPAPRQAGVGSAVTAI